MRYDYLGSSHRYFLTLGESMQSITNMKNIRIFDNKDKTADRYTVVVDTDVFLMSTDPQGYMGINMYAGETNTEDNPRLMDVLSGKKDEYVGKEVELLDISKTLKAGILARTKH